MNINGPKQKSNVAMNRISQFVKKTVAALFFFFFKIYNVVPISAVQESDQVIHILHSFSHTIFHYVLSQEIGYSSQCYTAAFVKSFLSVFVSL